MKLYLFQFRFDCLLLGRKVRFVAACVSRQQLKVHLLIRVLSVVKEYLDDNFFLQKIAARNLFLCLLSALFPFVCMSVFLVRVKC